MKKDRAAQELAKLAALPETDIDTREVMERRAWAGATRGRFYRPVKQQLTLRLDADVVAWFKATAAEGRYQTSINAALRSHMERHSKRRKVS